LRTAAGCGWPASTPRERAHGREPARYYAAAAAERLFALTRGRALQLAVVGEGSDRFGRIIGELFLPGGASVGETLVAEGAAFVYWHSGLPEALLERYLAAQRRAMDAGRGFWPHILKLPSPAQPYVGNAASRRFHAPGCPDARRISPRNRVLLPDLAAAFRQGFAPARDCTPWPNEGTGRP